MEEEIQQPIPYPSSQPMMMGHTSEGALQYQLESQETVERVCHIIKGETEIVNKQGILEWKRVFEPMVNQKGLNMIRGYLTMYLGGTKTFALTDLDDEYIRDEVMDIGHNIKAELMDNWTQYSVKDYASASFIINIVCSTVYAVLRKGEGGTYLRFLRTTQQISDVQHHQLTSQQMQPQQDKKGILGMIFGKK